MIIDNPDAIHAALVELARLRASTETALRPLRAELDRLTVEHMRLKQTLDDQEMVVRSAILAYMQETGDLHASPSVTFRRTTKLAYDKSEALDYALIHGKEDLVRRRVELNVRAFENAVNAGALPDFNAEVVNTPTLEIGRLGDLLLEPSHD